jgi:hypothetical protein
LLTLVLQPWKLFPTKGIGPWATRPASSSPGSAAVAAITGTAYTAPYRWQAARARGGTGGVIPQRHHRRLIDYARANGIPLSAEEFLAEDATSQSGGRTRKCQ